MSALRSLKTAQITYAATFPTLGFAPDLATLGPTSGTPTSTAADLIDAVLAAGTKSGYGFQDTGAADNCGSANGQFTLLTAAGVNVSFDIFACPISKNRTGIRNFCTSDTGAIHQAADPNTPCDFTAASPVIQ